MREVPTIIIIMNKQIYKRHSGNVMEYVQLGHLALLLTHYKDHCLNQF